MRKCSALLLFVKWEQVCTKMCAEQPYSRNLCVQFIVAALQKQRAALFFMNKAFGNCWFNADLKTYYRMVNLSISFQFIRLFLLHELERLPPSHNAQNLCNVHCAAFKWNPFTAACEAHGRGPSRLCAAAARRAWNPRPGFEDQQCGEGERRAGGPPADAQVANLSSNW